MATHRPLLCFVVITVSIGTRTTGETMGGIEIVTKLPAQVRR